MDVLAFVVVCGAIAAALLVNAYRCGRRGDVPLLLERAAMAVVAVFVGCLLFADQVFALWVALLGLSLVLLASSGIARRVEETAQEKLIAGAGGPTRARRLPAGIVACGAGVAAAVPGAVAMVLLAQWADSLSRVGQAVGPVPDAALTAAYAWEMQHILTWTMVTTMAVSFLPLVAAAVGGWIQHRRRRAATDAFERAVITWAERRAVERTPEECDDFVRDLENARLAHRLGLVERSSAHSLDRAVV